MFCAITVLASLTGTPAALELFGIKFFDRSGEAAPVDNPVAYSLTMNVGGDNSKLAKALKSGSILRSTESEPPSGTVGLISRANQDRKNLIGLLYEEGYYGGLVSIRLSGRELDSISVTEDLGQPVDVEITIEPGPAFSFGAISITGGGSVNVHQIATEQGLVTGERAFSRNILKTEDAIVKALERIGHPYPRIADRKIVADHAVSMLTIDIAVIEGPTARFGHVSVEGTKDIDPDFIAYMADIPTGEIYSSEILDQAKRRLTRIEALGSVNLRPAESLAADGSVPIVIVVTERKPRVIGAGANWSSTDGLNVNTYWKHRNLFGHGELLRLDVGLGRLTEGGSKIDNYDANVGILFSQPGFFGPSTRLDTSAKALQEHPDAFMRRAVSAQAIAVYRFNPELELSGGLKGEYSEVTDALSDDIYGLISLPLTIAYDSRDDPMNPSGGIRASVSVEPTVDVLNNTQFFKFESSIASYVSIDEMDRFVLAGRIGAGAIFGAERDEVPADRRFLIGGGGSVRGYGYRNIGVDRVSGDAIAGLSQIQGSVELRSQWTDTIGTAVFADAGIVSDEYFSDFGDMKVGVGLGLRYFTGVGPIRLDVAIPLEPDQDDPAFAFYVGIGQAF